MTVTTFLSLRMTPGRNEVLHAVLAGDGRTAAELHPATSTRAVATASPTRDDRPHRTHAFLAGKDRGDLVHGRAHPDLPSNMASGMRPSGRLPSTGWGQTGPPVRTVQAGQVSHNFLTN